MWPANGVPYMISPKKRRFCPRSRATVKVKRRRREKYQASPGEGEDAAHEDPGGRDEGVEEDDADDLEVDIVDGASRAEARTIQHLLTHRYKNPSCESCIRAKMRRFKTHTKAFKRKLKAFGDLVTFDFIDTRRIIVDQGIHTDREIFVVRDRRSSRRM